MRIKEEFSKGLKLKVLSINGDMRYLHRAAGYSV